MTKLTGSQFEKFQSQREIVMDVLFLDSKAKDFGWSGYRVTWDNGQFVISNGVEAIELGSTSDVALETLKLDAPQS